jgi:hypothetical protein
MAGDVHYIYIMDNVNEKDDNEKIIKELYLGKMRYWNSEFSLSDYKYHDDTRIAFGEGKYYRLKRLDNGRSEYGVLNLNTIDKIRDMLKGEPITEEEEEAYDDTRNFINFVDENLEMIKENNYDVVFYTSKDF